MKLYEINETLPSVKTLSAMELAKIHNVTVSHISKQLKKGIKVEQEHTNNIRMAKEIALDHIKEDPNYYDKLQRVNL